MINCSTGRDLLENAITYSDYFNATLSNLHPFTTYNCCVAAKSNHGGGKLACQSTVTCDQGMWCCTTFNYYSCLETFTAYLYNGIPTRVQSLLLNETSLLLSWHSPDALHTNGIIEEYHVQVVSNITGVQTTQVYTTEDTYLLINNLRPNSQYTFRVAAYAGERGQFPQPLTINTSNSNLHETVHNNYYWCDYHGIISIMHPQVQCVKRWMKI